MNQSFLIFLGAGFGGILRYWLSQGVHRIFSRQFPYGTMVVNISGCLLMGFLLAFIMERFPEESASLRAFLLIGLLGGYTTYSSFAIESMLLFENGQWLGGFLNIICTTTLCLLATWIGMLGGRQL